MAAVAKSCLEGKSFARNGPLSSKLRSCCGAAPILGMRVLPQNSMASAAFCETAVRFRGGRSVFCANAIGRYRMRGRAQYFHKKGYVNFVAGAAFHSFASVARRK